MLCSVVRQQLTLSGSSLRGDRWNSFEAVQVWSTSADLSVETSAVAVAAAKQPTHW
jgi:hypothetical protein